VTDDVIHSLFKLAREKGFKKQNIEKQWEKSEGQTNVTKISRAIGFLLRHNVSVLDLVNNLDHVDIPFSSFAFHLKRLIKQFIKDGTEVSGKAAKCPECKSGKMVFEAGCILCQDCNWSKCG
jgi:predicted nucleic acid-binding protein